MAKEKMARGSLYLAAYCLVQSVLADVEIKHPMEKQKSR